MEKHFTTRENLQALIEAEWAKYRVAIKDDKPFSEVKVIYLQIKELETEVMKITDEIHKQLNMGD